MVGVALLSTASASVCFVVADAKIFSNLRTFANKKSKFIGSLLSCGFCLGYWVCGFLEILLLPTLFYHNVTGYILTWLIMSWISGLQWAIMKYIFHVTGL